MKESKNICVHLTTGYYWLTSIETTEETSEERALEIAVAYAIKKDFTFDYVVDGCGDYNAVVSFYGDDDDFPDDSAVMEYAGYMYLDLSEYGLPNVWVSMRDTRIDHAVYKNTVTME